MAIGGILARDTTGLVTQTGPGTAGDVLTSNGAGAVPTFQTPGSGPVATAFPLEISSDFAVSAGTGVVVPESFEIDPGVIFEIGAGARVEVTGPVLPPSSELDYVEFTSPVSINQTSETTANTVVTGSSVSYDGLTAVMIQFFAPSARPDSTAAGRSLNYWLYQDGISIGQIGVHITPAALDDRKTTVLMRRMTPSNAAHIYSIRASVSAGTGSVGAGAGGIGSLMPGFIRITKATG